MKFLIATNNKHKAEEFEKILSPHTLILPSFELSFVEDGKTYEENSIIKLKALLSNSKKSDADIFFSDDSGLEIEFLDNRPGLYSSRFLDGLKQAEKNQKIIEMMKNTENRRACFKTFISFCEYGGVIRTVSAVLEGTISKAIAGLQGFGYDPIFVPKGYDKTMAVLGNEFKNSISHRSQAVGKMLDLINSK